MNEYIEATPANMRKYSGSGVVALDRDTGETFSATPGDYFMMGDDEPLTNESGEALVLAISFSGHKPITI